MLKEVLIFFCFFTFFSSAPTSFSCLFSFLFLNFLYLISHFLPLFGSVLFIITFSFLLYLFFSQFLFSTFVFVLSPFLLSYV